MTEIEAARLVRAALDLLHGALPGAALIRKTVSEYVCEIDSLIEGMDPPPWEPEPAPSKSLPWSAVLCGDSVQAPNGQWYHVESWSRTGEQVAAMIKGPDGSLIRTTPAASAVVPVRRGPAGQAMDIFTAGGLELTPIKSEVAA